MQLQAESDRRLTHEVCKPLKHHKDAHLGALCSQKQAGPPCCNTSAGAAATWLSKWDV